MKQADIVFLLNHETKQNVIEHLQIPEERLVVFGNGVNTDVYHPLADQEKELIREQYGLKGKRVIIQVGSIYENKGQLRSLEYLLPLMRKYPDLVYVYAGGIVDQEYQDRVLAFAADHGIEKQVRYLGMLSPGEELNRVYNIAQASILPSRYEAFSLVVIESCAAGTPVLVDCHGPISIGEGAVRYTIDTFEQTVEQLLENNIIDYRNRARENACSNYSWNKIASDYLDAFYHRMSVS